MSELRGLSLLDFIPKLSPEYSSPYHLREWCELMQRALKEPGLRGLCAVPIRHYKSETTHHGIIQWLVEDPTLEIIFLTHSFDAAQSKGKRIRQLAKAAGVGATERGFDKITEWKNDHGGGVVIMSAEQSRLGLNCHALVFDDPLDEFGAEDPKVRESVDQAIAHYTARCMRRGKPGPVLGVASRWHPDDPIGRRLARTARKWIYVHSPAVLDDGTETERAFAPDVWSLEELKAARAELAEKDPTERLWWAQFQQEPRPMGADLFGPATYYTELPTFGFRRLYGVDMAYTVGEGADWFARCVGRAYGPKLYLLDVRRHKIDAHLIESTCKADVAKWGRAPFFSYMSGPEVGMARVLQERGVPIARMQARYNKLVRAQRTVKRWNDGMILVPDITAMARLGGSAPTDALWVHGFVHRLGMFRGHEKDTDDDEVDALVSMCDGGMGGTVGATVKTFGTPFRGLNG